jgi:hypothetical protein
MTSRPAIANGSDPAWIGVAMVYPSSATVFRIAMLKASSSKLTGSGMMVLKASSTGAEAAGRGLAASGLPNRAREDERKTMSVYPGLARLRLGKIH